EQHQLPTLLLLLAQIMGSEHRLIQHTGQVVNVFDLGFLRDVAVLVIKRQRDRLLRPATIRGMSVCSGAVNTWARTEERLPAPCNAPPRWLSRLTTGAGMPAETRLVGSCMAKNNRQRPSSIGRTVILLPLSRASRAHPATRARSARSL